MRGNVFKSNEKNLKFFLGKGLTNRDEFVILAKLSGGTGVQRWAAEKDFGKPKKRLDKTRRVCYNSQAAQRYGSTEA